jgi:cobalt-zinc-cadmium efflux system membrane fusion protein
MAGLNTLNTTEGQIVQEFGIYAPINGYITGVAAVTGLFTRSDQMLMELVDLNSLQLNISVYEKDLISLKTDQDIIFYSPNQTRQKYKGKVISYSRAIDPESRTITVIGNILPEHQPSLIHGLFVEAEIITGTRPVTALPDEAILTEAGNTMVLVQTSENEKEMVFLRKMVKTGESMQGFTEILNPEGLENVLIKGGYNLLTE